MIRSYLHALGQWETLPPQRAPQHHRATPPAVPLCRYDGAGKRVALAAALFALFLGACAVGSSAADRPAKDARYFCLLILSLVLSIPLHLCDIVLLTPLLCLSQGFASGLQAFLVLFVVAQVMVHRPEDGLSLESDSPFQEPY